MVRWIIVALAAGAARWLGRLLAKESTYATSGVAAISTTEVDYRSGKPQFQRALR